MIEVSHLSKSYGSRPAVQDLSFTVPDGQIYGLLGPNGAGKSTIMNILTGYLAPTEGEVKVAGFRLPEQAQQAKACVGYLPEQPPLYPEMTVQEYLDFVAELKGVKRAQRKQQVLAAARRTGLEEVLPRVIRSLSKGYRQRVGIAQALLGSPQLIILDEPTAVLTPQETEKLFAVLRNMRADGKAIVIITHKLHEVMALSDKVAVLRKGKYIGTVKTSETNPQALTDMMVGHSVTLNIDRPKYDAPVPRLTLKGITCYDGEGVKRLDNVSFTALGGEILGIAGIAGSGQRELLEAIAGLHAVAEGSIQFTPEGKPASELVGKTPMQIKKAGVAMAFVPEDRLGMGLVGSMGMTDNMMLRSWRKGKGIFVNRKDPNELAMQVWKELEVVTPSTDFPVRRMSGGNVQKVLVGREIAQNPSVLMTAYAVRGLDINTSYTIYNLLTKEKMQGSAVIYVGEDLDVLLELCDRILVLCGGKVSGIVDGRTTTKEEVGLLMTRVGGKEKAAHE